MSAPDFPAPPGAGGGAQGPVPSRPPDPGPFPGARRGPVFVGAGRPDPADLEKTRRTLFVLLLSVLAIGAGLAVSFVHYVLGQAPHRIWKAGIGVALGLVILARPWWAVGLLPLAFVYDNYLPVSPIPAVNAMNLLIVSILLGWASRGVAARRAIYDPSPWNLPAWLFIAWYGFSGLRTAFTTDGGLRNLSALAPSLWGAVCGLVIFFPIYNSLRTWKQLRTLAVIFCVGSAMGFIGLVHEALTWGWGRRVGGGAGQVNVAAAYYATVAAFGLGLLGGGLRGTGRRLLVLGSVAASAAGIIIAASRGAYAGFLVGTLPQVFRAGVIWVVLLAMVVGAFFLWAPDYARERVTSTEEAATDSNDRVGALNRDAGGRIDFWRASIDVIAQHPVIGVGYGRLPQEIQKRVGKVAPAHNLYLETAAETGVPGLLLLLWLFGAGLLSVSVLLRAPGFPRALALAYQSAILVLMVSNIFGGRFYQFNMAGMVSLLTAMVFRARALTLAGVSEADEALAERLSAAAPAPLMAGGQ